MIILTSSVDIRVLHLLLLLLDDLRRGHRSRFGEFGRGAVVGSTVGGRGVVRSGHDDEGKMGIEEG